MDDYMWRQIKPHLCKWTNCGRNIYCLPIRLFAHMQGGEQCKYSLLHQVLVTASSYNPHWNHRSNSHSPSSAQPNQSMHSHGECFALAPIWEQNHSRWCCGLRRAPTQVSPCTRPITKLKKRWFQFRRTSIIFHVISAMSNKSGSNVYLCFIER